MAYGTDAYAVIAYAHDPRVEVLASVDQESQLSAPRVIVLVQLVSPPPPVDIIITNLPAGPSVAQRSTFISQITILDRQFRTPVNPQLLEFTYHYLNKAPITQTWPGTILQLNTGCFQSFIPPSTEVDKLRGTWVAYLSGQAMGSAEFVLDVVDQPL